MTHGPGCKTQGQVGPENICAQQWLSEPRSKDVLFVCSMPNRKTNEQTLNAQHSRDFPHSQADAHFHIDIEAPSLKVQLMDLARLRSIKGSARPSNTTYAMAYAIAYAMAYAMTYAMA